MKKQLIRLTESDLHKIIKESVKQILSEARKPSDKTVGKHTLKGLRYDKNGNPLYTSDTMSDDEKKNQGWRFSKKHGLYGQLSDPTKLHENQSQQLSKRILENALRELRGVIMHYGDSIRDCFTKQEMDDLHETICDAIDKINKSYDYGPYEGEPYHFGSY